MGANYLESEFYFDIRAEIFVALYKLSADFKNNQYPILYRKNKKIHPGAIKDLLGRPEIITLKNGNSAIKIGLKKNGLLGHLPEMSYLHVLPEEQGIHALSDQEKAKKYKQQIEESLSFLSPFDQELFEPEIELAKQEISLPSEIIHELLEFPDWVPYIQEVVEENSSDSISKEELYSYLDSTLKLGTLLVNRITGDLIQTASYFGEVVNKKVTIGQKSNSEYSIPDQFQFKLGSVELGENTNLGETFSDGIPILEVKIHDVPEDQISTYMLGGSYRALLEGVLYPYYLPLETHVETLVLTSNQNYCLGEQYAGSFLGFTTIL